MVARLVAPPGFVLSGGPALKLKSRVTLEVVIPATMNSVWKCDYILYLSGVLTGYLCLVYSKIEFVVFPFFFFPVARQCCNANKILKSRSWKRADQLL